MIFKTVQIQKCVGYILPENIFVIKNGKKVKLSKGTKINKQIKNILVSNGFKQISGFLLNENYFDENKASDLIARSICTNKLNNLNYKNLNTGRSNIYSTKSGLFIYNANNLIKLNNNSKIAISAIRPFSKVEQNQELITAKVIPYGIDKKLLQKNSLRLKDTFKVIPFKKKIITLIQTLNDKINEKLIKKSRNVTSDTTFIGINSAEIKEHNQNKNMLEVTVEFVSEIISCIKDKDNKVVSGDAQKVKKVLDTWKFTKDSNSKNPNWLIVDTQA